MNIPFRHILVTATLYITLHGYICHSYAQEASKRLHAFPAAISDSTAVVFKKDGATGVAIISNMRLRPKEGCDVQWFLRTDGNLDFKPSAPGLTTGTIKDTKRIKFGPFDTQWSSGGPGRGYVYFDGDYYIGIVAQPDLEDLSKSVMCAILVKDLSGLMINLGAKEPGK